MLAGSNTMKQNLSNKRHFVYAFLATLSPVIFFFIWFFTILAASYVVDIDKNWVKAHFSNNFLIFTYVSCALSSALITFLVARFHRKNNGINIKNMFKVTSINTMSFVLGFFVIIKASNYLLPKNISTDIAVFGGLSGMVFVFFLFAFSVSKFTDKKIKILPTK